MPRIRIELTPQEQYTLHAALLNFDSSLREDGLGEDEHGRRMVTVYLTHISSVLKKLAAENEVKVNPQDGKPWPEYDPRLRHHRDGFRTPPPKE